ncbi:MAG: class I SAM-dependent methyltransferase [Clostridiales bacterium]|nr:class I SAM-dependent methyltransferase [Clostridiales bacterium]
MSERRVSLTPRLAVAAEQLRGSCVVADIGCDHGRLAIALIQRQCCERVIAVDVSAPSLEKAKRLIDYVGLSHTIVTRLGDGFSALAPGECDAVAILGLGGVLITEILARGLNGAKKAVLQPMRGQAALRRYLYENAYHILNDRIVRESRRYYQVITVEQGTTKQPLPAGWPEDCFDLGFVAWQQRDPLFPELARKLLTQYEKQLAGAWGSAREPILAKKAEQIRSIV